MSLNQEGLFYKSPFNVAEGVVIVVEREGLSFVLV